MKIGDPNGTPRVTRAAELGDKKSRTHVERARAEKKPAPKLPIKDEVDFGRNARTPVADAGLYTLQDLLGTKNKDGAAR